MEFHGDAIVLSGVTGTMLKCEVLGKYYPKWWSITSGGKVKANRLATSIVELNAGSGEDYIEETKDTILGSFGHALRLKLEGEATPKLKVLLIEENQECFDHLKNVIRRRWSGADLQAAEGPQERNNTGVYLLRKTLDEAIETIEPISLGNSLFFFDPLLYTPWKEIERVAQRRIKFYYMSRTEFVVFLFTSDWFLGRPKLGLAPLPQHLDRTQWSTEEEASVSKMDDLFGMTSWRKEILSGNSVEAREAELVSAYKTRLHRWFRYVLPMPFKPKPNQLFHLFMCSNYELGITLTRRFYEGETGNEPFSPDNAAAYSKFKKLYPRAVANYTGHQRPLVWKTLWAVIRNHEEGLCDIRCDDLRGFEESWQARLAALQWLEIVGYLRKHEPETDAWQDTVPMYKLDWEIVKKNLGIEPPKELLPLEPVMG